MATPKSVFLIGAGYIGQHVLDLLLAAKHPVTTLVRKPEQAAVFEQAGAKTVLGTLSDFDLLTSQTAQHEITINTASCDDLPSVEAVLAGIRQRISAGLPSIYLHTSGTGALMDNALGMYKGDKIYRDDEPATIDAIPVTSMHRHVDIPIVQAARDEFGDKAKVVILLPPIVYGFNPAHKRLSMALPILVRFALKHGFTGYVGEGLNTWSAVHVADLGRAYMTLLSFVESAPSSALLDNPYFFAEDGVEVQFRDLGEHVSQLLYKLGRIQSTEVKEFVEADYADVIGPFTPVAFGCNSRNRAIRLRELGWDTREKGIWESLEQDEISYLLSSSVE